MELINSFLVPKATGKAFLVKAGQVLRLTQPEGPQVIYFDAFSLEDPREYLLTSATRRYESIHVTEGHRLWSGGLRSSVWALSASMTHSTCSCARGWTPTAR